MEIKLCDVFLMFGSLILEVLAAKFYGTVGSMVDDDKHNAVADAIAHSLASSLSNAVA